MADDRSASMLETMAIDAPHGHYDVAVLGGGLAGLTIAIQLKRERPETRVLVTDKRAEPAPEAAFKVGESSVEIGAYYYREMVGMRDHLEKYQQRKLGLRFYMPAGDNSDITKRVEFCTPGHLDAFTHQIDRGRFENELFRRAKKAGADAFRGWRVQDVSLGEDRHTILMSQEDEEVIATARWIVDASGRANILRRKLDLGAGVDTGHRCNAAWIRLAGGLDFEDWTDDEEWLGRMPEKGLRIHSTSHLIQPGYWLWLIQLESGPISIGVCADERFHPWEDINSFEGFMEWMKRNEPQLHAEIDGRREDVLDFLRVKDFSYGSSRFFSPDRWTLVGEAGGFLDALYSPGSDFIGFSNTFSCELIERDLDGEDVTELAEFYNDFYLNLFNTTAHLYRDNYQLFGNPQVMVLKFVYDSSTYFVGHRERVVSPTDAQARGHQAPRGDRARGNPDGPEDATAVPRLERDRADAVRGRIGPVQPARAVHPGAGRDGASGRGRRDVRDRTAEPSVPQCARGLDLPPGGPEPPRAAGREPGDQLAGDQPASRAVGGRRPVLR